MPDLPHDARPVGLADRAADEARSSRARIAAGDTKSEIEDKLVAKFGDVDPRAPSTHGFDLLAWLLPLVGAARRRGSSSASRAWRWSRAREPLRPGRPPLDPALERRVDDELARFEPEW